MSSSIWFWNGHHVVGLLCFGQSFVVLCRGNTGAHIDCDDLTPNYSAAGDDTDVARTTKERGVTGAGYAKACRGRRNIRMCHRQSDLLWHRLRPYICSGGECKIPASGCIPIDTRDALCYSVDG